MGAKCSRTTRRCFPHHPLDLGDDLKAPVFGLYGGCDAAIPIETIRVMEARLAHGRPAARASQIQLYPDAGHAFFADYRDSYRADLAEDAWRRCIEWLGSHDSN